MDSEHKEILVTQGDLTVSISGPCDSGVGLQEALIILSDALMAWGYRFNGDLDIIPTDERE